MPKIATSRAKASEFRIQSPWFRDFLRSNIFVPKRVRQRCVRTLSRCHIGFVCTQL